jgi:tetratricopeptide (TPR) repeat protein
MGVPVKTEPLQATALEPSASVAANASLIAARELSARRTPFDLAAAIEAIERAIGTDPDLVAAWCALAELHVLRASLGLVPPAEAGEAAVLAAEKAFALDPDSSPAVTVRGWVKSVIRLDVAAGLADFERSLRITDGYWAARAQHAWALVAAGSLDRGLRHGTARRSHRRRPTCNGAGP